MTMNVSNYEFKNGLYLPRENSRPNYREVINFSEEQRREAIKQRTRDAVAKKPQPKLNKNAQEYLKKIQQELATTGEATQLVPTAKHPLAGAAYASRQTALERLWGPQVLDLGNGATSTTYFGTAEELRNVAPLGNIAPALTPAPAPTPAPTPAPAPAPTTVNVPTGGTGTSPHTPSNVGGTGGTIIIGGEQPNPIGENTGSQRIKTIEQRQAQLQRIRNNPKARARYNRLKLRNNPELATRYESFSKTLEKSAKTKAWKKAGKAGLVFTLAAGAVYGVSKLFGGDDNKNAEVKQDNPVQAQNPVASADTTATQKEIPAEEDVKAEETQEAKPVVTPAPVAENAPSAKADATTEAEKADDAKAVVAKPETEETEEVEKTEKTEEAKEAEEAKKAEEEINEWIAQNGENYWKYAKQELIFEHQGQADYKPTNKEINERMLKIMERNGVEFANDGIHPVPMLKIGDKVKVKFGTEEKAA